MGSRAQQVRAMLGRSGRACAAAASRQALFPATWQHATALDDTVAAAASAGGGSAVGVIRGVSGAAAAAASAAEQHLQKQVQHPFSACHGFQTAASQLPPKSPLHTTPSSVPLLSRPAPSSAMHPLLLSLNPYSRGVSLIPWSHHTSFAAALHSQARPWEEHSEKLRLCLTRGMQPLVSQPTATAAAAVQMQHHRWLSSSRQDGSKDSSSGSSRREVVRAEEEDVFSSITDKIPERPVTAAEGASYSLVILAALAVAAGAAYFVVKELLLEPKEYKVFNKALQRVQNDPQVVSRLGSPITGYGQESRNRAARQRISHRVWKDEEGVERIQVQFHIRGTGGTGLVHAEMFKDSDDGGAWKFTYLLVDVMSPSPARLMLESYVPT